MRPELAARLAKIARGEFAQKPRLHVAARVTANPVTPSNPLQLHRLRRLQPKNDERAKDAGQPVSSSIAGPVEPNPAKVEGRPVVLPGYPEPDQVEIDERAGLAINGGVPAVYADAWARMNCRKPYGVTEAEWRQALDDGGQFLGGWWGLAVEFEWTPGDLFDVPSDGTAGGLIWWISGEAVRSLGGDCAFAASGRIFDRVTRGTWENPNRWGK
jgi:hypothetical protein